MEFMVMMVFEEKEREKKRKCKEKGKAKGYILQNRQLSAIIKYF